MSNMSYCRFENTSIDLSDCRDALEELLVNSGCDDKLSRRELDAARSLVETCQDILEMVAEHACVSIEDLNGNHIQDALYSANSAAEAAQAEKDEEEDDESEVSA